LIFQTCGSIATDSLMLLFTQHEIKWLTAISSQQTLPQCISSRGSTVTYGNTPTTVTWSEPFEICCYVIVTQ